ncbi:MAG: tRNA guanosine(34) transglycosylase Tgt, partial [Planctomycetes bacterium]|nr:tRNA guanosine(34) transglycosylase Tgt [Planctomycetota bacterium]
AFECLATDGKARRGRLRTPSGIVETPAFMPVGTAGSVKGLTPRQLRAAGVEIILANTYHLILRPGAETVGRLGGLHRMMAWEAPILTDSGGYQVFSLAHMRRIDDTGVRFRSHIDGAEVFLDPERAVAAQRLLGADIIMQLDECPPAGASRRRLAEAVRRSIDWARRSKDAWLRAEPAAGDGIAAAAGLAARCSAQGRFQALFGIQQGGTDAELRGISAEALVELDLPGYAVGGLGIGEGHDALCRVLDEIDHQLPRDRPRYLMGVGEPRDIFAAVGRGIDMFDCVLPTRNGRNAQAFTAAGRLRLRNARWTDDREPIEPTCDCYTCRNYSRGTLRHLFQAREMLAPILVSIHNLRFFTRMMSAIRQAIRDGCLEETARQWLGRFYGPDGAGRP